MSCVCVCVGGGRGETETILVQFSFRSKLRIQFDLGSYIVHIPNAVALETEKQLVSHSTSVINNLVRYFFSPILEGPKLPDTMNLAVLTN